MPNRKPDPEKYCEYCGKKLSRKRYNGVLESYQTFLRRTHCDRKCGNSRVKLTKHGYSWRARKHLKKKCEACGWDKKLQAHHIDQDITNNEPENIQTLCKPCHDFWHTTAKKLGRTVAGRMVSLEPPT